MEKVTTEREELDKQEQLIPLAKLELARLTLTITFPVPVFEGAIHTLPFTFTARSMANHSISL